MSINQEEFDNLKSRLANTEKAFFAMFTVMHDQQCPETQRSFDIILNNFFDANSSLGMAANIDFDRGES